MLYIHKSNVIQSLKYLSKFMALPNCSCSWLSTIVFPLDSALIDQSLICFQQSFTAPS